MTSASRHRLTKLFIAYNIIFGQIDFSAILTSSTYMGESTLTMSHGTPIEATGIFIYFVNMSDAPTAYCYRFYPPID